MDDFLPVRGRKPATLELNELIDIRWNHGGVTTETTAAFWMPPESRTDFWCGEACGMKQWITGYRMATSRRPA